MKWWHFPAALLSALSYTLLLPLACLVLATVWAPLLLTTGMRKNLRGIFSQTRPSLRITFYGRRSRPVPSPYKTLKPLNKAKPYVSGYGRSTATSNGRS